MRANAQNSIENTLTNQQVVQAERDRIKSERDVATQMLEQQRAACYQKLAVTPCLNEARDAHNEKTRDLKRQEVALNDAQRKRAAADRLRIIEERNSPQAQQTLAERRGRALAASAEREQAQQAKQNSRPTKQTNTPAASDSTAQAAPKQAKPTGVLNPQPSPKTAPTKRPDQAAKIEKNRQQAAAREKAAEMRRAEALQREAKRKKTAAAPLPIPD